MKREPEPGLSDPMLAAIEAMRAELAALREEIQELTRRMLSADDRRHMKALLPDAHALMGSGMWTVPELVQAARSGASVAELVRVIDGHTSERGGFQSLGHLLARCEGATSAGFRLRKVGNQRLGWLYTVVRVSEGPKPAAALAPVAGEVHDGYTFVNRPNVTP